MHNESLNGIAKYTLLLAQQIQNEVPRIALPPEDGLIPKSEKVIPFSLVRGTRGYIEKVVNQVNGCYENGCYDGCSVMVRRLIETLIIETFEYHGKSKEIQNSEGEFFYLNNLIDKILSESSWNLGRNAKPALKRLKNIGDQSAHNRRFIAHRNDIDKYVEDLRLIVQELIFLAELQ